MIEHTRVVPQAQAGARSVIGLVRLRPSRSSPWFLASDRDAWSYRFRGPRICRHAGPGPRLRGGYCVSRRLSATITTLLSSGVRAWLAIIWKIAR
jgi:hypothetical protein